jgi:hypothetical protein
MNAYPSAKVILTVRDEDSWLVSMNSTLLTTPKSTFFSHFTDYHFGPQEERGEEEKRRGFKEHRENVKRWTKERRRELLVYEVNEGWAPLCAFLGTELPGVEFPRSDDWATKGWKKVVGPGTET